MEKPITINDLKDLELRKVDITPQQRLAIKNFERHKKQVLSEIKNEAKFQMEFQRIQAKANLSNFEEFLKEEYL